MSVENYEEHMATQLNPNNTFKFQATRLACYLIVAIQYALVTFQKQCPTIVSTDMAESYGVGTDALGVFSSVYFYPYGVIQIFAGLLSDVFEPAYVVGVAQSIAAIGAFIIGASKSVGVGILGRLLTGLGCGPTYVAVTKIVTNWYRLDQLGLMLGILVAIGGIGGLIASSPLELFCRAVGWNTAFFVIGGITVFFVILTFVFVRGNPMKKGFAPVNENLSANSDGLDIKAKLLQLWENFKVVLLNYNFWLVAVFNFFMNGPYSDISGMWAGPYLMDVLNYTKAKKGTTVMSFSFGLIAGSLLVPQLSTLLKTRKWICVGSSTLTFVVFLIFVFVGENANEGVIWVLFILIGAFTNPLTSVSYPLVREYYHPSVAATAVGTSNMFTFLSAAVFQQITSSVIAGYKVEGSNPAKYTWQGYKIALYVICTVSLVISVLGALFAKDTNFNKLKEEEEGDHEEEKKDEEPEPHEIEPREPSDEQLAEL